MLGTVDAVLSVASTTLITLETTLTEAIDARRDEGEEEVRGLLEQLDSQL